MEQDIYSMDLHEMIVLEKPNCIVIRVASGWVYKFYTVKQNNLGNDFNEFLSIMFIPFDNRFQK